MIKWIIKIALRIMIEKYAPNLITNVTANEIIDQLVEKIDKENDSLKSDLRKIVDGGLTEDVFENLCIPNDKREYICAEIAEILNHEPISTELIARYADNPTEFAREIVRRYYASSISHDNNDDSYIIIIISSILPKMVECLSNNRLYVFEGLLSLHNITDELKRRIEEIERTTRGLNDVTGIDTLEQIVERSVESAQKYDGFFRAYLFSEKERSDPLRLCDVYVDPCISDDEGNEYGSFEKLYSDYSHESVLFLEGEAGSGKSSLLMRIANRYLNGEIFQDRRLFFVQGKEIRHSEGIPMDDIMKVLKLQCAESLDGAIVFLDAYDEISFASTSAEKNQEYLSRLLRCCEGFTLIITVRNDYIKKFSGLRFQLHGFNPEQRKSFLLNYNTHRSEESKISEEFIDTLTKEDSDYEDGIYQLLSIPMLLYMIAVNEVDISKIIDKFDLYELVFSTGGQGTMLSRGNDQKVISKNIWSDSYELALKIAKNMFFNNDPFIAETSIKSFIDNMDNPKETKDILKNRFGIEIFLTGNNSSIYSFVHKSIFEYFTAKGICAELTSVITRYIHKDIDLSDVIVEVNKIFSADYFDESIFYYVMFAINRGYVRDAFESEEQLRCANDMLNKLLDSQLCDSGSDTVPYIVRLKNLLLWVFNSFSVVFGLFEINGDAQWVEINQSVLQYILRIKESEDSLFISHCNLRNMSFYRYNLGSVFFVDNDLTGSYFGEANCREIVSNGQIFQNINFYSADFWGGEFSGCIFDNSDLRFSDFRDAQLCGASFRNADLRDGIFTNADLSGAIFTGAHIYLEDFENANCDDGAFDDAIIHDRETDDPSESILCIEIPEQ